LIGARSLAVDAGTGDGLLLDVLAPLFERVVAIDRSQARLREARERGRLRHFRNVAFIAGEPGSPGARRAARAGADLVVASRVLHHAAQPARLLRELAALLRPGGALIVIDYAAHTDESMRDQADVWMGFDRDALVAHARTAGLTDIVWREIPPAFRGAGADRHLDWQAMFARRSSKERP
jgi:ubiquinone/menaquinone biosynthesis C-methylase UbiE